MADEKVPVGSNTLYKTMLAVHDEKIRESDRQKTNILKLIEQRRLETERSIQKIRDHVSSVHDESFLHTNERYEDLENKIDKKYSELLKRIDEQDERNRQYLSEHTKRVDDKLSIMTERTAKMPIIDNAVDSLKEKVSKLENWKWYIAGMAAAMSTYALYQNFFHVVK